jgi:hypothetical protein
MSIREVAIIDGTESPVGEGVNYAWRSLVRFDDETVSLAIIKKLDARGFSAEIFCSLLCRAWGLSVPEVTTVKNKEFHVASVDTSYPNLKQRLNLTDDLPEPIKQALILRGAKLVSTFSSTPLAIAVDEAINNKDRNLGNILWDGNNVSWIDHERALGYAGIDDVNKLVTLALMSGDDEKIKVAATATALTLSPELIVESTKNIRKIDNLVEFQEFVLQRIGSVTALVLNRFPKPNDLLSNV